MGNGNTMQPPDGQAVNNTGLISIEIFMEIYFMRMFNITVRIKARAWTWGDACNRIFIRGVT